MKQHFYSSIVEVESLFLALEELDLDAEEKKHLRELADSNLYHTIIDAILSELSDQDKKVFLEHIAHNNHDKVWDFLNDKVENIGDKIRKAAHDLRDELHKDIKEVKDK